MSILEFASDSPALAFILSWLFLFFCFSVYRQTCRTLVIRKHGYPPAHCNVDGLAHDDAEI